MRDPALSGNAFGALSTGQNQHLLSIFLCNRFAVVVSVVTIATGFSRSYYY